MKALLLALAACGSAQRTEPPREPTPYCFYLQVRGAGLAKGCAAQRFLCERARDKAITFSGLAGFDVIGACREEMR